MLHVVAYFGLYLFLGWCFFPSLHPSIPPFSSFFLSFLPCSLSEGDWGLCNISCICARNAVLDFFLFLWRYLPSKLEAVGLMLFVVVVVVVVVVAF